MKKLYTTLQHTATVPRIEITISGPHQCDKAFIADAIKLLFRDGGNMFVSSFHIANPAYTMEFFLDDGDE